MDQIRFGIAGSNELVQAVLEAAAEAGMEVSAIWTKDTGRKQAEKLASDFDVPALYFNYEEMLRNEAINSIYIALPASLHAEYALKALQAGKNVLIEKPLTSTYEEALSLAQAARESNKILFEVIPQQDHDIYQRLKFAIGHIGEIKLVELNFTQMMTEPDTYIRSQKQNQDLMEENTGLLDLNTYNLHFLLGLFGEPQEVAYHASRREEIDYTGILILRYQGFIAEAAASRESFGQSHFTIQGTRGLIHSSENPAGFHSFVRVTSDGTEKYEISQKIESSLCSELKVYQTRLSRKDSGFLDERLEESLMVMKILGETKKQTEL